MSPEKQRIAIAEACGWQWEPEKNSFLHPENGRVKSIYFPYYLNDLNAMHEAEMLNLRSLSAVDRYRGVLRSVLDDRFAIESDITACAAHRAEAFLRTLGKWEESQ